MASISFQGQPISALQALLRAPIQTARQMEGQQLATGALRVLKTNEDDRSEALYRARIYATYSSSARILTHPSQRSIRSIFEMARMGFEGTSESFEKYFQVLDAVERHSVVLSDADCVQGVKNFTAQLEAELSDWLVDQVDAAVECMGGRMYETATGIQELIEAMDVARSDAILDRHQCFRVLCGLWQREAREGKAWDRLKTAAWEAKEMARKMCYAAAQHLERGRLGHEQEIIDLCAWLEDAGDGFGSWQWIPQLDGEGNAVNVADLD